MNTFILFFVLSIILSAVADTVYPDPPATYQAADYTKWNWIHKAGDSRRAEINVQFTAADGSADYISLIRLDLQGDAYSRGFAHGKLLTKEIVEFVTIKLDEYYAQAVLNLSFDVSGLPEAIQKALEVAKVVGAKKAPAFFHMAFAWVWQKEVSYVPKEIIDEISGIANGICDSLGSGCNVTDWTEKIQQTNMLPEFIRMACTAYGAWGKATPDAGLIQLRALDFGPGPFSNYTIIQVHRNDPANPGNAFASVAFPGFVGAITGVSQSGIGISEKVWMVYGKKELQWGRYDGLADIFTLRHILEFSKSKAEAEDYMQKITRTWGMWVGVGDYATQSFDLVGYKRPSATVYTDVTMPSMTGQPAMEGLCYVDKHPQPSADGPTGSLPAGLQNFYGQISLTTTKQIVQAHTTGDVQIAVYDFKNKQMIVAVGRTNKQGDFFPEDDNSNVNVWKAYNRPYVQFSLEDLWAGK